MKTIHWLDREINRHIFIGHMANTMEQANSTMFFNSVSMLVSFTASPKQPQSLMGLAMANQSVIPIINIIKINATFETMRLRMASKMKMPNENSKADKATDAVSVSQPGARPCHDNASR